MGKVYEACQHNNIKVLKSILSDSLININHGDYDRRCPLHIATDESHYEIVYYLLQNRANYKQDDRWNNSMYKKIVNDKNRKLACVLLMYHARKYKLYNAFNILKSNAIST